MAAFTLFGTNHQLLARSMQLRAARHEVLTANIANAETPGYAARDFEFSDILAGLVRPQGGQDGQDGGNHAPDMHGGRILLAATHPQHVSSSGGGMTPTTERQAEGKLDENGVDLDYEVAQMTENALLHETSMTLLSKLFAGLRYAISEGRAG